MTKAKGFVCGKGDVIEVEGEARVLNDMILVDLKGVEPEEGDVVTIVIRL